MVVRWYLTVCVAAVSCSEAVASVAPVSEYKDTVRTLGELNVVALKQQELLRGS